MAGCVELYVGLFRSVIQFISTVSKLIAVFRHMLLQLDVPLFHLSGEKFRFTFIGLDRAGFKLVNTLSVARLGSLRVCRKYELPLTQHFSGKQKPSNKSLEPTAGRHDAHV
jgi:hypothetical protein